GSAEHRVDRGDQRTAVLGRLAKLDPHLAGHGGSLLRSEDERRMAALDFRIDADAAHDERRLAGTASEDHEVAIDRGAACAYEVDREGLSPLGALDPRVGET